jgi:transcription-repair coupling factor (superfamily II helicase)
MKFDLLTEAIRETCLGLLANIQEGQSIPALGLRRAARLPVMAALLAQLKRPALLVTDRADHALTLSEELELWAPEARRMAFPEPTPLFYEDAAWGDTTRRERLLSLTTLAAYHIPGADNQRSSDNPINPPVIVAPARALMTRTLPRREFLKSTRMIRRGQKANPDDLARLCMGLGYEPFNAVIASGQFARRGGIFDVWPPAETHPIRLEFFGDEIEFIRSFDPATQRTIKESNVLKVQRLLITPAREFLIHKEPPNPQEVQTYTEFQIPILHPEPSSILDYLPSQALIFIDDRQALEDMVNEIEEQALSMRQDFVKEGTLADDYPVPYLTWEEFQDSLLNHQVIDLGLPSARQVEGFAETFLEADLETCDLTERFNAGPRFGGRLKLVMEYLIEHTSSSEQMVVVSRQAARLRELWIEQAPSHKPENMTILEGSLAEGWIFSAPNGGLLHLLTDGEIFGWRRPEPRRRARPVAEAPETAYTDLQVDDYVVHVDHGIGCFKGLVQRTMEGIEREYLCIEYADEAQLFTPIHQADRLTRYVGPDGHPPVLSRLGGMEWRNVKAHVKEAVVEVAEDLLELYAKRSLVEGYAFGPDTTWQQELESSFPYIETEDQDRVLAEVKRDMEKPLPMDRLICGDVGYGKTEVALRAAFKSVMDGKQVAILVPTTVLAQQHYNTFLQRMAAFPVVVEMLSRFRTPQQQQDIINRLAQGKIDILIGTHRILSKDVELKDLGLLIIDEEQRFGVTHKETLKKMRTEVDVLTMTATPIPRTLYMTLSGIRDISTINTPPEERLPIVTHVGPYSPRLARQAILRELERGGQVFFVHNRVQTIGAMETHLRQLAPEARITIAHGQMDENELAQRMEEFTRGEVDVLLSTSIIESGLDIPNANTLIVDLADTFGLAQLYQLRGRVGRGAQRAYAYFFRHNRISPTNEGRARLETIAENTQLGSGFSIAMRDLEIRGSGDILGTRQHGHIAAVGFHLYTALLAEAARRLRMDKGMGTISAPLTLRVAATAANVELPLPVSIPADYVPDKTTRLGLYRRMADIRSLVELDTMVEEFKDRFGSLPEMVHNLFLQLKIRLMAEQAGLASISVESNQVALRYPDDEAPVSLPDLGAQVRIGKTALWMAYSNTPDWAERLLETLARLNSHP